MRTSNKVLVTGASGFVGKYLVPQLSERGFEVYPLVRRVSENTTNHPNKIVVDDLLSFDFSIIPEIDNLVHLVAKTHDFSQSNENDYHAINVKVTEKIAALAIEKKVEKFIYLSSVKVFGESTNSMPFNEKSQPNPEDFYGQTKYEAEQLLDKLSAQHDIKTLILRIPILYGPLVKANFKSLIKLTEKVPIIPLGGMTNKRSILGLDNLSDCIANLLERQDLTSQVFCVADDPAISTSQLLQLLIDNNPKAKAKLVKFPLSVIGCALYLFGKEKQWRKLVGNLEVSSSKIKETINWEQPYSTSEQLSKYFNSVGTRNP